MRDPEDFMIEAMDRELAERERAALVEQVQNLTAEVHRLAAIIECLDLASPASDAKMVRPGKLKKRSKFPGRREVFFNLSTREYVWVELDKSRLMVQKGLSERPRVKLDTRGKAVPHNP